MISKVNRKEVRRKRHYRLRNTVNGTSQRPRLAVFRSSKHIYVQVIDDVNMVTLAQASTVEKDLKELCKNTGNKDAAKVIGKAIGERSIAKGIDTVVFDRGGYLYHGRVKELADAAREAGLKF